MNQHNSQSILKRFLIISHFAFHISNEVNIHTQIHMNLPFVRLFVSSLLLPFCVCHFDTLSTPAIIFKRKLNTTRICISILLFASFSIENAVENRYVLCVQATIVRTVWLFRSLSLSLSVYAYVALSLFPFFLYFSLPARQSNGSRVTKNIWMLSTFCSATNDFFGNHKHSNASSPWSFAFYVSGHIMTIRRNVSVNIEFNVVCPI